MRIHDISISLLREYDNNPRNNDGAVDAVAASIREFGFKVPVIVDGDNVIVAGHRGSTLFLSAALRDSQSWGCFNGMRDADTECLKRGYPYYYDDDEALYCSAKGDEH